MSVRNSEILKQSYNLAAWYGSGYFDVTCDYKQ